MDVFVSNEQNDLPLDTSSVSAVVTQVLKLQGSTPDEVSVYFLSDPDMCALHNEFFNDPSSTDCMSFPIDSTPQAGYQCLGEVFVCPKVACDYVAAQGGDVYREVTLYIIHGLLHLLGYDDLAPEDKERMDHRQAELLALICPCARCITPL